MANRNRIQLELNNNLNLTAKCTPIEISKFWHTQIVRERNGRNFEQLWDILLVNLVVEDA